MTEPFFYSRGYILSETQDDEKEEDDKNHKIFISDISLLIDEL